MFKKFLLITWCLVFFKFDVALSFYTNYDTEISTESIIEGWDTTIEEAPYLAIIGRDYQHLDIFTKCSATIISEFWLLTAAHCLDDYSDNPEDHYIITGKEDNEGKCNWENHRIAKIIVHDKYNMTAEDIPAPHDIALIKVENSIEFSDCSKPIAIATLNDTSLINEDIIVAGFGRDSVFRRMPRKYRNLQSINEKVLPLEDCKKYYPAPLINLDTFICARNVGGSVCQGDSGGPAIKDAKVVGLTSFFFGDNCLQRGPDLFTRVALYHDWIQDTISVPE